MSKYILLVALLAMACTKGICQITSPDFSENSLVANTPFARFDRSENGFDYYWLKLNMFQSEYEHAYFYKLSSDNQLYINDKNDFISDTALFLIKSDSPYNSLSEINKLYYQDFKPIELTYIKNKNITITKKGYTITKKKL